MRVLMLFQASAQDLISLMDLDQVAQTKEIRTKGDDTIRVQKQQRERLQLIVRSIVC